MSAAPKMQRQFGIDSNARKTRRLDLRPSDGLRASIQTAKAMQIIAQLYDISPNGLSIVIPHGVSANFVIGEELPLEILFKNKTISSVSTRVRWKKESDKGMRFGLEILQDTNHLQFPKNTLELPAYIPVMGFVYKPYMFFERSHVCIKKVSTMLWEIEVFDTDILCFKGVDLEIFLNSNAQKESPVRLKVVSVLDIKSDSVILMVEVISIPKKIETWIGQQLVFVGGFSPEQARDIGFSVGSLSNGFKFRYVKTLDEYNQVLELRYKAYRKAGKVVEGTEPKDMAAPLDYVSRILAAFHNDKIVGSIVVSFPTSEDMILDTERAFSSGYPKKMPLKQESIEIARLCTDPDYRKSDLLVRIFEYTYKTLHCGDRKYIVTSTDNKMWSLYKKMGFKKTGMSYAHPYLAGLEHHVIYGTHAVPDFAQKINPLAWNYMWRDMGQHLESVGELRRSPLQKFFVKLYSLIGRTLRINLKKHY